MQRNGRIDAPSPTQPRSRGKARAGSDYIGEWLDAFELLRARGTQLLDSFSRRITRDLSSVVTATPSPTGAVEPNGLSNGGVRARLSGAIRQIRRLATQHRLLRASHDAGSKTLLVAMSSRRLPLPAGRSPRQRLATLTRAMPGAPDQGVIGREIAESDAILLFEPFRTGLWDDPLRFWSEGVFLIDYAFVAFTLCRSPAAVARALARHGRFLLAEARRGRSKSALAAVLLEAGYEVLLRRVSSPRAYFLTSNSFASEILRLLLLRRSDTAEVCEVLHGIPTEEFEEYLETLLTLAGSPATHAFIQQLPSFPPCRVVAGGLRRGSRFAVNTAINRYFSDKAPQLANPAQWVEVECERIRRAAGMRDPLVVTLIGATGTEADFFGSRAFRAEAAIVERAAAVLRTTGRPFVLCYAPHPVHPAVSFERLPLFQEHGVIVCPDTVLTWLLSDVCVGLYSSALFEAQHVGVDVFTPLRLEDRLYTDDVLGLLRHPRGDAWLDALAEFLEACARLPSDDMRLRAERRLAKLAAVERTDGRGLHGVAVA